MVPHRGSTDVRALVAGLALCALVARPAAAQKQIGMGRPVTGALTEADPVLSPGQSHYKLFSFYGTARQTVEIDLTSDDFDPRLELQDWQGQSVARDDVSGGARNARITYTLHDTGMYQILAGARRADEHGAFTLSVIATEAVAQPEPVAQAQPARSRSPSCNRNQRHRRNRSRSLSQWRSRRPRNSPSPNLSRTYSHSRSYAATGRAASAGRAGPAGRST